MPRDDEVAFTAADVEILREVGRLMAGDVASADLVLQMSRVIGSSMARIASSQVDVISAAGRCPRAGALADTELTDEQIVVSASALLPIVPSVLDATWRRHLQGAIRRRLSIAEAGQGQLGWWASPTSSGSPPSASRSATTSWRPSSTSSSSSRSTWSPPTAAGS